MMQKKSLPLPKLSLLVLDTETTGFVPKVHKVIEYACMKIEEGTITDTCEQLIGIAEDIPPHVEVLTQIKSATLKGQPTFEEILPAMEKFLTPDTVIVGQNISFDIKMLRGEGWDISQYPRIDTSMLASIVFPELESYSLGYLSTKLQLAHEPKHRALGDVRATAELLSRCFMRLQQLPQKTVQEMRKISERGEEGYRLFFSCITGTQDEKMPLWLTDNRKKKHRPAKTTTLTIDPPQRGSIAELEESLHPECLEAVMEGARQKKDKSIIAVKNMDATLRRMTVPKDVWIHREPEDVTDEESVRQFLSQKNFNDDELTLAIKLQLYAPKTRRDLPLHGEEKTIWKGKIAKTTHDRDVIRELQKSNIVLMRHSELLRLLQTERVSMENNTHIIIDDASMLEDTATTAYGKTFSLAALRASSEGEDDLTTLTDSVELWIEKTRNNSDIHYLSMADRTSAQTQGLCERIRKSGAKLPSMQAKEQLDALLHILDPKQCAGYFAWIENYQDRSRFVKSAPENIAHILKEILYDRFPTSLIIPSGAMQTMEAILPHNTPVIHKKLAAEDIALAHHVNITVSQDKDCADILRTPKGKMVLLLPSKRSIEDIYIKYAEHLEKNGVSLFCQGFNGGQSRMQAEFMTASEPAVLVLTPWTYETYELPLRTLNHLVLTSLPFDHPSHAVISHRALQYDNPFTGYSLPRLMHRLFRIFRTFCRQSDENGVIEILDNRLRTKTYGKEICTYLQYLSAQEKNISKNSETSKQTAKQMRLL